MSMNPRPIYNTLDQLTALRTRRKLDTAQFNLFMDSMINKALREGKFSGTTRIIIPTTKGEPS